MLQRCPCVMEGAEPPFPMSNTVIIAHPAPKIKHPSDAQRAMIATLTLAVLRLLLAALGAEVALRLAWRALLEQ